MKLGQEYNPCQQVMFKNFRVVPSIFLRQLMLKITIKPSLYNLPNESPPFEQTSNQQFCNIFLIYINNTVWLTVLHVLWSKVTMTVQFLYITDCVCVLEQKHKAYWVNISVEASLFNWIWAKILENIPQTGIRWFFFVLKLPDCEPQPNNMGTWGICQQTEQNTLQMFTIKHQQKNVLLVGVW